MLSKTIRRSFSSVLKRSFSTKLINEELSSTITRVNCYSDNETSFANRKPTSYTGDINGVILDWSGTTADAHVIAPAIVFYEVFAKHDVPITMAEARLPMGLRKDLHIEKILEIPTVKQRWIDIKGEIPNKNTVNMLFKDFVPMQVMYY